MNLDVVESMKEASSGSIQDMMKSISFIHNDGTNAPVGKTYERYGGELWEVIDHPWSKGW
jgi:hypothetical protein